jgi:acetyl-CoA synthetase
MLRLLRSRTVRDRRLLHLRRCTSAGEALPGDVGDWADAALAPTGDVYGQTEIGGWCLRSAPGRRHGGDRSPAALSAMTPASGFDVRLVSRTGDVVVPVAPGSVGEIAINVPASPLMSFTRYLNDPRQTTQRLTSDGVWYLTGDAGVGDQDGTITYLARSDDLIVSGGFNVSPTEIEDIARQHPSVADAAAIGAGDPLSGQAVQVYVVMADGRPVTEEDRHDITAFLRESYGTPAEFRAIQIVDQLPRSLTGKLQRARVRAAAGAGVRNDLSKE